MKTRIQLNSDSPHKDYRKGEIGFIDGYIKGIDERPYAVVVLEDRSFVLADIHHLMFVEIEQ